MRSVCVCPTESKSNHEVGGAVQRKRGRAAASGRALLKLTAPTRGNYRTAHFPIRPAGSDLSIGQCSRQVEPPQPEFARRSGSCRIESDFEEPPIEELFLRRRFAARPYMFCS